MELKDYQQQALGTLDRYLEALKAARRQSDEFSTLNISDLGKNNSELQMRATVC